MVSRLCPAKPRNRAEWSEPQHPGGTTMSLDVDTLDEYVSLERGEINRKIFADEEIFEQEMELIFGRAWQFLCHETQIPKAGDFFETPVGRDNVLTVRQKDGSIKCFL